MKAWKKPLPTALFLSLPLLLYGAAVNPYFPPGTYDDIVFYYGARSLAESGSFQLAGKYIVDWAPGLSVLLSVPMSLGFASVWAAKLCILLCVGAGLFLTFGYLRAEGLPRPLVACTLFALLPTGFMMGTDIMTEWPFVALSFLFLGLLKSLDGARRGLPLAALAGLVLGAASLTRWVGVMLGVAVFAQALSRMKTKDAPGFRAILPEGIVAAIGAALFCLWKLKLIYQVGSGAAEPSTYYRGYWYLKLFTGAAFSALPLRIGDLFFQASSLGRGLGVDGPAMRAAVWTAAGLPILWGAARLFRRRGIRPGDWYALATLVLFALLKQNPQVRYLLPIAPFLLTYFLAGIAGIDGGASGAPERAASRWRAGLAGAGLAAWIAALVAMDGYLLFRGNVTGSHAGLCRLVSPNADAFYKGPWKDLYRAGRFIAEAGSPEAVSVTGQQDKYVLAFSGHSATDFPPKGRVDLVVEIAPDRLPDSTRRSMGLRAVGRFGTAVVYRAASTLTSTMDAQTAAWKGAGRDDP